jgi:hypothetical protein
MNDLVSTTYPTLAELLAARAVLDARTWDAEAKVWIPAPGTTEAEATLARQLLARTEDTRIDVLREAYGINDKRGREIGGQVEIDREVWVISDDRHGRSEEHCKTSRIHDALRRGESPVTFTARPWATRNGEGYGATQPAVRFPTEAEARAYAAEYFQKARKRAARNG